MSVTIKLKNASGSDPSASDLVVGEVALRTDSGQLFTKKDNGSVQEIGAAAGVSDGDKGDITVSSSGSVFTIDNDVVSFAKMQNIGTPSFLGRNSSGTGNVENLSVSDVRTMLNVENGATADQTASEIVSLLSGQNVTIGEQLVISATTPNILFTDTNNNPDYRLKVDSGALTIEDAADNSDKFVINSDGHIDIINRLDAQGGIAVTGNISVSGTVDGRDVATDGSKLDGIESNATADQTASEILTLIKTVDGSGSGLDADTLDGISSASFVRSDASDTLTGGTYTLNSSTDQKFILAGATNPYIRFKEGSTEKAFIQWNSAGYIRIKNQEDSSILRIKDDLEFSPNDSTFYSVFHEGNLTVGDGGLTQNNFTNADHSKLDGIESGATADQTNSEIKTAYEANSNTNAFTDALLSKLNGIAAGATNVTNNNQLTNGAGYVTANTQLSNEQVQDIVGGMVSSNTESGITVTYQDSDGTLDFSVASQTDNNFTNADHSKLDGIESGATADQSASEILTLLKTVDGSGSGLDADTLDGANASVSASNSTIVQRHSSGYIFANFFNTTPNTVSSGVTQVCVETGNDGYIRHGNAAAIRTFINVENGATADQSASEILTLLKTVDGSGSGLDADTLDGVSSGSFARSDANDTLSGIITLSSSSRDCLNFSANSSDDNRGIAFNGRIAISADYADGYLRLNNASEFANGVYTPLVMRADNGFSVDGTTVINGSAQLIASRLTGALPAIDGSALTGISAGATGGGSDELFYENGQTMTTNYTITNGKNAMCAGPITINSGVTLTIGSGENLTIV